MAGDNDLEAFAISDLTEAWYGLSQVYPHVKFTALVDRAEPSVHGSTSQGLPNYIAVGQSTTSAFDWTNVRLLEFEQIPSTSTYGWRDKGGSWSETMTDPNTLTRFITSQLDQSATYTFLELWNHGSAYAGFAYDRGPVFTVMNLANMDLAISNAVSTVGKKFTILGFDACYMSSYSVLSRFTSYADYFLVSEGLEPASGWDYRSLRLNANADPETYGRNIIDAFISSTLQNPRVLALIDATKFSIFVSSFTAFLDTLLTLMQGNDVDIVFGFGHALNYCMKVEDIGIDIGDFLSKFNEVLPNSCGTRLGIESLLSQYSQSLVYFRLSNQGFTGINIYSPQASRSHNIRFNNLPTDWPSAKWKSVLEMYSNAQSSSTQVEGFCAYVATTTTSAHLSTSVILSSTTPTTTSVPQTATSIQPLEISNIQASTYGFTSSVTQSIRDSYAEFGTLSSNDHITVYATGDGDLNLIQSGIYSLTFNWNGFAYFISDGIKSATLLCYQRLLGNRPICHVPAYYYPNPSSTALSATILLDNLDGSITASLYASSNPGNSDDQSKTQVSFSNIGKVMIPEFSSTWNTFHTSNTESLTKSFTWSSRLSFTRRLVVNANEAAVMTMWAKGRSGELVYTTRSFTSNGQFDGTSVESLQGTYEVTEFVSETETKTELAKEGVMGIVFGSFLVCILVSCCGYSPSDAARVAGRVCCLKTVQVTTTHQTTITSSTDSIKTAIRPTV